MCVGFDDDNIFWKYNDNDYLLVVMDNIAFKIWVVVQQGSGIGSLFIILCSHNYIVLKLLSSSLVLPRCNNNKQSVSGNLSHKYLVQSQ